jgi:hypothetical protein
MADKENAAEKLGSCLSYDTLDNATTSKDLDKLRIGRGLYDNHQNIIHDSEDGLTDRGAVGPLKA